MFTGIIEEQGIVTSLIQSPQNNRLTISVKLVASDAKVGDSISVNGVCLTIVNLRRNFIEFDISPETLKRTTLRDLKVGERVNLERALKLSTRLGGHLVSGHIDGVGEIRNKVNLGKGFELHVSVPSELLRYLVPKGSISIDGVSLTVADLRNGMLMVSIIPHSCYITTLGSKKIGDRVNLEVDMLSKYIEKHLERTTTSGITEDTLSRAGFFPMGWIDN